MIQTEFGTELKKKVLEGINKLNDSVSSTLGPSGRNVIIKEGDSIKITKDGVTVAKAFTKLKDPIEDIGIQLLKSVSKKSGDKAGDGTTTSTLLATVMIAEGLKLINQGSNPVEIKKGIDKAVKAVVERLKEISIDVTEEQIKQVATISGNNDTEVGNIIATALEKVGHDGVVTIEESKTGETSLEIVEGMLFERGFVSPYFITHQNLNQAVLEKPYILLFDGRISSNNQIVQAMQAASQEGRSLLVIAEEIDSEALATMIVNKVRGTIKLCVVKSPDFGDRRTMLLEDMAVLTGGKVISPKKGENLEKIMPGTFKEYFGQARLVTVTPKETTIVDGKGTKEAIETRLLEIKEQYDNAKSNFDKQNLQDRIGKLTGGVAIISVGGLSEVEMMEKKDRIDDALHATKAAIEQGIVPGGGMAFIDCKDSIDMDDYDNADQHLGMCIVRNSLSSPFKKILENAGIEDHYEVLNEIKNRISDEVQAGDEYAFWEGFNVKTGEFCNLKRAGIIDPTKVTRIALENAASVAGTFLTTESAVFDVDEDEKKENISLGQFGDY